MQYVFVETLLYAKDTVVREDQEGLCPPVGYFLLWRLFLSTCLMHSISKMGMEMKCIVLLSEAYCLIRNALYIHQYSNWHKYLSN